MAVSHYAAWVCHAKGSIKMRGDGVEGRPAAQHPSVRIACQRPKEDQIMNSGFVALRGECRCARVRFEITTPPIMTMACHCTGCQRMSASAFSLSAAIPSAAFSITQGEPVIGGLRGALQHFFCDYCMSWLFTRADGFESFVNIRVTMLEEPRQFPPYIETYTSEKLPWASTPAVYSFPQFPPLEDYEGLTKKYASHVWAQT